jgi:hypothetical protein
MTADTSRRNCQKISNAEANWLDAMQNVQLADVGTHAATTKLFGPDALHIGQLAIQPRAQQATAPLMAALLTFHRLIGVIADALGYSEDVD